MFGPRLMRRFVGQRQAAQNAPSAWLVAAGAAVVVGFILTNSVLAIPQPSYPMAPPTLQATGLYSDFEKLEIDPEHLPFSPQYPLWTDGATKRRWISLPPRTAIDASDPDAWSFPVGTRLWKEFSFAGQRVETRYIEQQPDGQWLYAAYAWSPDGREASLTPERGKRGAYPLGGGRSHTIPSISDCKVCHQGARSQVLGFSTLQLSPDRDPFAPHAEPQPGGGVDLSSLVKKGLLVGLDGEKYTAPRVMAGSATERAALGYLHANCGHCHHDQGALKNIGLFLRQATGGAAQSATATTIGVPVKKPAPGQTPDALFRVEPGHPDRSVLMQRVRSRYSALQMPPLGTELVDDEAVALIQRWIGEADEPRTGALREGAP